MDLRNFWHWTGTAVVAGGVTIALVGCGGASTGDVPTSAVTTSSSDAAVSTSDVTDSGSGATDRAPAGPPEEALAACDGLDAESACSFISPRDGSTIDGICRARRDDADRMVCFPSDWDGREGPGHGHGAPPEEALAACEGLATGTACSFEAPFGTVDGTCSEGPDESGQVACRPNWAEGEGPGHDGRGPEEARTACEELEAGAACSFEGPFGSVSGTCRLGRDGVTLVCAPTDGPVH